MQLVQLPTLAIDQQSPAGTAVAPQRPDGPRELGLDDAHLPADPALGHIVEPHFRPRHPHLIAQQGCDTAGAVLLRVFLAADPEDAAVEQSDRHGLHAPPFQTRAPQIGADLLAKSRQLGRDLDTRSNFSSSRSRRHCS